MRKQLVLTGLVLALAVAAVGPAAQVEGPAPCRPLLEGRFYTRVTDEEFTGASERLRSQGVIRRLPGEWDWVAPTSRAGLAVSLAYHLGWQGGPPPASLRTRPTPRCVRRALTPTSPAMATTRP